MMDPITGHTYGRWAPKKPQVTIDGDIAIIEFHDGMEAIIDASEADMVSMYRWKRAFSGGKRNVYVRSHVKQDGKWVNIILHRLILNAPHGILVDHIDGDGLNNRRCNLRLATRAQNGFNRGMARHNSSGFKGVIVDRNSGKYYASIRAHGTRLRSSLFSTPEEAHDEYCRLAVKLHGEFSNFGEAS